MKDNNAPFSFVPLCDTRHNRGQNQRTPSPTESVGGSGPESTRKATGRIRPVPSPPSTSVRASWKVLRWLEQQELKRGPVNKQLVRSGEGMNNEPTLAMWSKSTQASRQWLERAHGGHTLQALEAGLLCWEVITTGQGRQQRTGMG